MAGGRTSATVPSVPRWSSSGRQGRVLLARGGGREGGGSGEEGRVGDPDGPR
ncbi:hypothetical protein [Rubrobacter marinus]|uniref:hypothetical protein n=1 Tax=Rubrobacter marinus TaxID=2653852 RepID=UPI001408AB94|nr:hypothetical protein [Rubrobacter marinus]